MAAIGAEASEGTVSGAALVSLERLNLRGAFINADVDAEVSFSDMMTVNKDRDYYLAIQPAHPRQNL